VITTDVLHGIHDLIWVTVMILHYITQSTPLIDNEQLSGYKDCASCVIVPFKKRHGEVRITGDKRAFNIVHRWYRARVEHSIGYLKAVQNINCVYVVVS